jgi:hypothetical protein
LQAIANELEPIADSPERSSFLDRMGRKKNTPLLEGVATWGFEYGKPP